MRCARSTEVEDGAGIGFKTFRLDNWKIGRSDKMIL